MASTLTIRLSDDDREILANAARSQGEGISTLVRGLAEAEARRLRHADARGQIAAFSRQAGTSSETTAELNALAATAADWPTWDAPLPDAWRVDPSQ